MLNRISLISLCALSLPVVAFAQESTVVSVPQENKLPLSISVKSNDKGTNLNKKSASASSKQKLMELLQQISFFSADFSQKVVDDEANVVQQGRGQLVVSKPNLVRWKTTEPEETLIVSDGETLWFFDPFIEQASAYTVDASIANTPILLLSSNDESLWQNFSVTQVNNETFLIHSNDINSRVKTLELNFTGQSTDKEQGLSLSSFSLLGATGQLSVITLDNFDNKSVPNGELFTFTLPDGVELDDQR